MLFADYTGRIGPTALKSAGITGVCRYLSWLPNSKVMDSGELWTLLSGDIRVVANWEYDTYDWLGGAYAGRTHGVEAVRQLRAMNYPLGWPVPGSADFDMTRSQWITSGMDYAMSYAGALIEGGYRPGVYGSWDTLTWCHQETPFDWWTWQSMSHAYSGWRNANEWPGVNLRQRPQQTTIAGVVVDISDVITDWGNVSNLDYGPVGKPGLGYAGWSKDGVTRADMQGAVLLDLASQEFDGFSDWDGKSKSQRQILLEEVRTNVRALLNRPQGTVTLSPDDRQAIIDGLTAGLKPLIDQLRHRIADAEAQSASTLSKD